MYNNIKTPTKKNPDLQHILRYNNSSPKSSQESISISENSLYNHRSSPMQQFQTSEQNLLNKAFPAITRSYQISPENGLSPTGSSKRIQLYVSSQKSNFKKLNERKTLLEELNNLSKERIRESQLSLTVTSQNSKSSISQHRSKVIKPLYQQQKIPEEKFEESTWKNQGNITVNQILDTKIKFDVNINVFSESSPLESQRGRKRNINWKNVGETQKLLQDGHGSSIYHDDFDPNIMISNSSLHVDRPNRISPVSKSSLNLLTNVVNSYDQKFNSQNIQTNNKDIFNIYVFQKNQKIINHIQQPSQEKVKCRKMRYQTRIEQSLKKYGSNNIFKSAVQQKYYNPEINLNSLAQSNSSMQSFQFWSPKVNGSSPVSLMKSPSQNNKGFPFRKKQKLKSLPRNEFGQIESPQFESVNENYKMMRQSKKIKSPQNSSKNSTILGFEQVVGHKLKIPPQAQFSHQSTYANFRETFTNDMAHQQKNENIVTTHEDFRQTFLNQQIFNTTDRDEVFDRRNIIQLNLLDKPTESTGLNRRIETQMVSKSPNELSSLNIISDEQTQVVNSNIQSQKSLNQYALINILNGGSEAANSQKSGKCQIINSNLELNQNKSSTNIMISDQILQLKRIQKKKNRSLWEDIKTHLSSNRSNSRSRSNSEKADIESYLKIQKAIKTQKQTSTKKPKLIRKTLSKVVKTPIINNPAFQTATFSKEKTNRNGVNKKYIQNADLQEFHIPPKRQVVHQQVSSRPSKMTSLASELEQHEEDPSILQGSVSKSFLSTQKNDLTLSSPVIEKVLNVNIVKKEKEEVQNQRQSPIPKPEYNFIKNFIPTYQNFSNMQSKYNLKEHILQKLKRINLDQKIQQEELNLHLEEIRMFEKMNSIQNLNIITRKETLKLSQTHSFGTMGFHENLPESPISPRNADKYLKKQGTLVHIESDVQKSHSRNQTMKNLLGNNDYLLTRKSQQSSVFIEKEDYFGTTQYQDSPAKHPEISEIQTIKLLKKPIIKNSSKETFVKSQEISMNEQQKRLTKMKIQRDLESQRSFQQNGDQYEYVFSNFVKKVKKSPQPISQFKLRESQYQGSFHQGQHNKDLFHLQTSQIITSGQGTPLSSQPQMKQRKVPWAKLKVVPSEKGSGSNSKTTSPAKPPKSPKRRKKSLKKIKFDQKRKQNQTPFELIQNVQELFIQVPEKDTPGQIQEPPKSKNSEKRLGTNITSKSLNSEKDEVKEMNLFLSPSMRQFEGYVTPTVHLRPLEIHDLGQVSSYGRDSNQDLDSKVYLYQKDYYVAHASQRSLKLSQ